ncbi:OmpH family outer membrane protein [Candidatus Sumerlaeota bacterium]|nr:OmpH family outer membrane protein [Candidatus Sumerlaeota bacterium]
MPIGAAPNAADEGTSTTLTDKTVPGPTRVGFVDIEVVLDSSEAIRAVVSEVDSELGEQAKAIDARKREQRRAQLAFDQQESVLSETERASRQEKIAAMLNEIDDMEYRFQKQVRDKQRTTVEPLLEQVIRVIGDVGKREKYDLILRGEMALYGSERADVTPLVIKELDARVDEIRAAVLKIKNARNDGKTPASPKPLPLIP